MNKFGVVIVLYKPTRAQVHNVIKVSNLCPYVVAVDNSLGVNKEVQGFLKQKNILYLRNENAGGIAGAFNRGILKLQELGAEAFFIFDQDSTPDDSFFLKMNQARLGFGLDEVIIGPNVFDVNLKRCSPRLIFGKWTYQVLPMTDAERGLLPCSSIISSGTLITDAAFRKIGLFREDYFIDHVDTEYCLRARSKGVGIFINADVILPHSIGERNWKRFLFISFRPNNHNAIRRYYISRNGFSLCFSYGFAWPSFVIINFARMAHEFLGIVFFEKDKLRKVLGLLIGLVDAAFFKLGDLRLLRPGLFNYLSR
jgi:rhamnosyltransferase